MEKPRKVYPPEYLKAVDKILMTPSGSPKRWRMAVALYLNLNPRGADGFTAKEQYVQLVKENKITREQQDNKFATNKSETMRLGISAPSWFMTVVQAFDPHAFDEHNPDAKKNIRNLFREFRELKIMEKV